MIMADAFLAVMHRECDPASDADTALWNAAWDTAKRNTFWK